MEDGPSPDNRQQGRFAMELLPTVEFFGRKVTRLICGGNPFSGVSHQTGELSREMTEYYTGANLQKALAECERSGINTIQNRGDRHISRMYMEHRLGGGGLQWIAQIASEMANLRANVQRIAAFGAMAIYHHGTHVDNLWHEGRIDEVPEILQYIKDEGLPAGMCSHMPEVIEYAEEHDFGADFYMCCFYNLSRKKRELVVTGKGGAAGEQYLEEDRARMVEVIRQVEKPCLAFKILAAGRNCATPADLRRAFEFAFENIKPTDAVVVGVFQKHANQIAENAGIVREILDA